jgi:hypothetical protein
MHNRYYGRDGTVYAEQDGGGVVPFFLNSMDATRAEANRLLALYKTQLVRQHLDWAPLHLQYDKEKP